MNKKHLLLGLPLIGLITSCGCGSRFRDDLDAFIRPIRFDNSYSHVEKATLIATRTSKDIKTSEVLGSEQVYLHFSKGDETNLFYHLGLRKSGELKLEKDKTYQEKKIFKENNTLNYSLILDDVKETKETNKDFFFETVNKFFYLSNNNGLKSSGMYYGDELPNMFKMQNFLEVDQAKNQLKIDVQGLKINEVNTSYTLYIDSYGMLLSGAYDMKDDKKQLLIDVSIQYNELASYDESKIIELRGEN